MTLFQKPFGVTSNDFKYSLIEKNLLAKKSCYCGRLDPMARGTMLFLENEQCRTMDNFLHSKKTYEFEIIIGFSTDTDDILGIIDNTNLNYNPSLFSNLEEEIKRSKEISQQNFHRYSSFMLRKGSKRMPLWQWNKLGQLDETDIPRKNVTVYNIDVIEEKEYSLKNIVIEFKDRISLLDKRQEFRQDEIVAKWLNVLEIHPVDKTVKSVKIRTEVSSGFYIRELCNTLKQNLNFPMLIHDINRIGINN